MAVEKTLHAKYRMGLMSLALAIYHAERDRYPIDLQGLAVAMEDAERADTFMLTAVPIDDLVGQPPFCVGRTGPISVSYEIGELAVGSECPSGPAQDGDQR